MKGTIIAAQSILLGRQRRTGRFIVGRIKRKEFTKSAKPTLNVTKFCLGYELRTQRNLVIDVLGTKSKNIVVVGIAGRAHVLAQIGRHTVVELLFLED